ncbi:hypothetical protein B0H14DRAFT_2886095 [Mycena olivaceomarginata]|nr:hypothetical protein B0H14DRAFT_2886095 [Mycena olivaceomarginata]
MNQEREANTLIQDIVAMNKGNLDELSYKWPAIDFAQVSTRTCNEIGDAINSKAQLSATASTPQRIRFKRELNLVVTEWKFRTQKRVLEAQKLEDALASSMDVIYGFLRAAATNVNNSLSQTANGAESLLVSLRAAHQAMSEIENMARGEEIEDPDRTDYSDSDEDVDKTKVEGQ